MLSSGRRDTPPPRAVRVRIHRLIAAIVTVVALPLTLSACGLIGGDGQDQAPVVIPSEAVDDGASPADNASPADSGGTPAATSPLSTAAAAPAPANATVTKTGIVVQNRTQTQTRTRTATATKTLPQVTVTQPPITLTETRTETRTQTQTVVQLQTVTVTRSVPVVAPPVGAGA